MGRIRPAMIAIAIGCWSPAPPAGAGEPVLLDETTAVVNREIITRGEVNEHAALMECEQAIELCLAPRPSPESLRSALDALIRQHLVLAEARDMDVPQTTDEERERLVARTRSRFPSDEKFRQFLRLHRLTEESLGEMLASALRAERAQDARMKLLPPVQDAEVEAYYRENRVRFGGAPLSRVAEAIRLRLLTQRREEFLSQWLYELRSRASVQVLSDPAREPVMGK